MFNIYARFREQSICPQGNCSILKSIVSECSFRIFTQNSLLQMPSCHITLQAIALKKITFGLENNHGFVLWFFEGFCFLKWIWIHSTKQEIFLVLRDWLHVFLRLSWQKEIHFRILRFFFWAKYLYDSRSKVRSWSVLKKHTLNLLKYLNTRSYDVVALLKQILKPRGEQIQVIWQPRFLTSKLPAILKRSVFLSA